MYPFQVKEGIHAREKARLQNASASTIRSIFATLCERDPDVTARALRCLDVLEERTGRKRKAGHNPTCLYQVRRVLCG